MKGRVALLGDRKKRASVAKAEHSLEGRGVVAKVLQQGVSKKDSKRSSRVKRGLRGLEWGSSQEQKGAQRQPVGKFRRGKPRDSGRGIMKARERGVYGCGRKRAKRRGRLEGVSERARRGRVGEGVRVDRESRLRQERKEERVMGGERQRKENEGRERERKRGTVRGKRIARGLPVRGQRTGTNGKTARKRNRKRGGA
jgi:ribosomal protein S13